jgi:hypothetical protein
MILPRRLSQPDRPETDEDPSADAGEEYREKSATPAQKSQREAYWDDPGCLLESAFRERCYADEAPETIILAWLSILPNAVQPDLAARSLIDRLSRDCQNNPSERQRQLLELLDVTTRHRRNQFPGDKPLDQSTSQKKGKQ